MKSIPSAQDSGADWSRFGIYYVGCPHGANNIRVIESGMLAAEAAFLEEDTRRRWVERAEESLSFFTWH